MTLGIFTPEQHAALRGDKRYAGCRVAYSLMDVGENPTEEEVRRFEDISFVQQTANGTFRTSFRGRFKDVDAVASRWLQTLNPAGAPITVEDRAVSHGLTSVEWAREVFRIFPEASFEASDLLLYMLELSNGGREKFITDRDGAPLQYIRPPFVVAIGNRESWRNPILRSVSAYGLMRFHGLPLKENWFSGESPGNGIRVRKISCVHPEARALARSNPRFRFCNRSVFETSSAPCRAIRTMNILNRAYFSDERLAEGIAAIFHSLEVGGLWIVGRTLESDFTNHATLLRREEKRWSVLERVGTGSDIEELAVRGDYRA